MPSTDVFPPAGRIGDYLHCPPADIQWALSVQAAESAAGNAKRLGKILVEREEITEEELKLALREQRVDRLRRCCLLEDLSQDNLSALSERVEEIKLLAGEDLYKENQTGDSMYVVACGCIAMYRKSDDSAYKSAGTAGSGAVLGELGYFTDGKRSCSACALEPSLLLKIHYNLVSGFIS